MLPPAEQPEDEGQDDAEQEAGHQREVKGGILSSDNDVPGQSAETDRELVADSEEDPDDHQDQTKDNQRAAQVH